MYPESLAFAIVSVARRLLGTRLFVPEQSTGPLAYQLTALSLAVFSDDRPMALVIRPVTTGFL
jgi:hypothetical protein